MAMIREIHAPAASGESTQAAARRGFKGFESRQRQRAGKADVKESEGLRQIINAWKEYFRKIGDKRGCGEWEEDGYLQAIEFVRDIDYCSTDVGSFCLSLSDISGGEWSVIGIFLSALVNEGKDSGYKLSLDHLDYGIFNLCYRNKKNVIISGKQSSSLGEKMESGVVRWKGKFLDNIGNDMSGGTIIIEGSGCGCDGLGLRMSGGEIVIEGNFDGGVGYGMKGGKITICGDVDGIYIRNCWALYPSESPSGLVGEDMTGGEIHINGSFSDEPVLVKDNIKGGKIYHRGKLIVDK